MKSPSKIDTVKSVTKFVIAYSVRGIFVTATRPASMSKPQKIQFYIGTWAIGALVANATETFVDEKIDDLVALWEKIASSEKRSFDERQKSR